MLDFELLDDDAEARLGGGDQVRGLQHQDKFGPGKKLRVRVDHVRIVNLREGQNPDFALGAHLGQVRDPPEGASAGVVAQEFLHPLTDVVLHGTASDNDQDFPVIQELVNHREQQIVAQIPVERIEQHDALVVDQCVHRIDQVNIVRGSPVIQMCKIFSRKTVECIVGDGQIVQLFSRAFPAEEFRTRKG